MRASRHSISYIPAHRRRTPGHLGPQFSLIISFALLLAATLLPGKVMGTSISAPQPPGSGLAPVGGPLVTGADYTLAGSQFQGESNDTTEKSFTSDLTLPSDKREAVFTSNPTKAPLDFTDLAPRWSAETPEHTSLLVELRTGPDGRAWDPWQPADLEDIIMAEDSITQTYASMISVSQDQGKRTHRYVQSRVTLRTDKAGVSPLFRELTYTFIDAGITPNPPRPTIMMQGTPSDIPKPLMVSRKDWGSPQGDSSPKWTPKYKRITHIIIHHTATPNADRDFAARVRAVWYFHTKTRGWGDIGYNYVIDPNGVIYEGRAGGDDAEAGHAYPFNAGSMGIGMLGNFMTVAPSAAAQAALIDLISWKSSQRGIDPYGVGSLSGYTNCGGVVTYVRPTIAGHRDYKGSACGRVFNSSTCPGDRLYSMLPQIRSAVVSEQPPLRATFTGHDTPGNIDPGATLDVHVTVRNTGSQQWAAQGDAAVKLGYLWQTPDGKIAKGGWKEIRTSLPQDVSFPETITVTAKLNAPTASGHYALVWDMMREGLGWFGDVGSLPLRVDVVVGRSVGDRLAPKSTILPVAIYSNDTEILVRWAGEDEAKGSGIVSYDVQSRTIPNGQWTNWKTGAAEMQATFEGQDGYAYEFRSRARDAAGNVEPWPDKADAYTTVDIKPPALAIDFPIDGSHVQPGTVTVTGKTEPGTFVAVNDKRADEANGVFTSTVQAGGRDFLIHVSASDAAGNVSRLEVVVQAAPKYNDVKLTDPAFQAVETLSDRGIVSGYTDGSFRPLAALTRGQLAKILVTTFGWGQIKPFEGRFTDVTESNWMYPFVETAAARGVMRGYSDGTFQPNSTITRGELIKSLVQAAGWNLSKSGSGIILDVPGRNPLSPYIETARVRGIIAPDAEGNFYPDAPATRSDVSVVIYKALKYAEQTYPNEPDDNMEHE